MHRELDEHRGGLFITLLETDKAMNTLLFLVIQK